MAHNHGNEYQIRIVREDGTEELSGWMNSRAGCSGDACGPQATSQNSLADGTKDSLSQLLKSGTDYRMPHSACPVSTTHPTRLPLSAGSGAD